VEISNIRKIKISGNWSVQEVLDVAYFTVFYSDKTKKKNKLSKLLPQPPPPHVSADRPMFESTGRWNKVFRKIPLGTKAIFFKHIHKGAQKLWGASLCFFRERNAVLQSVKISASL